MKIYDMILLDLDGVLEDFDLGSKKLIGLDPSIPLRSWEKFYEDLGLTEEEFWNKICAAGRDFWANLPKTPDADQIFAWAKARAPLITYCSATQHADRGGAEEMIGKVMWLRKHGWLGPREVFFCRNKSELARPGRLLIDDRPLNCQRFIEAGGEALLVRRSFNANEDHGLKFWEW